MDKDNKKFIVETIFLREALKHELSLKEFLILMFFDNSSDYIFDVKKISKSTCLSENDVLTSFGSLLDKKLIILNSVKNESGKLVDKISLDNFYSKIKSETTKKEKDKENQEFFNEFQALYGRSLSGMDYEYINNWLASGLSEDLIIGAVKEANFNGMTSLRYIDRILFEWQKKGFKTLEDVDKHLISNEENNTLLIEDNVLEYNWLDEE